MMGLSGRLGEDHHHHHQHTILLPPTDVAMHTGMARLLWTQTRASDTLAVIPLPNEYYTAHTSYSNLARPVRSCHMMLLQNKIAALF